MPAVFATAWSTLFALSVALVFAVLLALLSFVVAVLELWWAFPFLGWQRLQNCLSPTYERFKGVKQGLASGAEFLSHFL